MPRLSRAALLACGSALVLTPRLAGSQTLEQIRICGVPTDDFTHVFYAIRNGLYRRAGLDVAFTPINSGSASTAAVIGGAYEIGKGSLIATLAAHLKGIPITIVANEAIWNSKLPYTLLLVAADSPIRTGADCNGKVLATAGLNDLASLGAYVWVDKNGGDSKSLRGIEVPNSTIAATLIEHRADVGSLNEPQLSAAIAGGKLRVLGDGNSAIGDHWVFGICFARPDWAGAHAEQVKTFARVTYEAATYTNAHKAETVPMMAEITKISPAIFEKMVRVDGATSGDPALIQPAIDVAAKYKFITRSFPAKELYFGA